MRISFKWLQQYVELNASIEDVAATLTRLGLEVESIELQGKGLEGFRVAEVLEVKKHPNADRLKVCSVLPAAGQEPLQIVCGAPNVAAGQKVILGVAGTTVPHNQHDPEGKPFVLNNATIRGVESKGMLCSGKELGISDDGSGIMVLDPSAVPGTLLTQHLGLDDCSLEIGITPNRPDCLSHIGIARDLAAAYGVALKMPNGTLNEDATRPVTAVTSVEVLNAADCPRYTARVITNVTVKESPEWMKQALTAAGLRPINNVVDVTNYVMLEYGQPLHAFDMDRLEGKRIVVRSAAAGEVFETLDGKKHTLSGTELMICDAARAVAIGGVMGGANSEISPSTTNVLLESAYFLPTSVRKTAKRLGISTDASYRFERGIDPNMTQHASDRAAQLLAELTGGTVAAGIIDVYPSPIQPRTLTVRVNRVNAMLGTELSADVVRRLLTSIGIAIKEEATSGTFTCSIPTFRPDIEQEIDLIEEVARLHGYDNIENKSSGEVVFTAPDLREQRVTELRRWLESNGVSEIITNSLIDRNSAALFSRDLVSVRNPLSAELEVLRPSMLATMLQTVAHNFNHSAERVHLYEIGTVFAAAGGTGFQHYVPGVGERSVLGICLSGDAHSLTWHEKQRKVDIFDIKGLVTSLLTGIGLDNSNLIYYNAPSSLTEMTIGIEINGSYVGFIGRCRPDILKRYKIDQDVFYAELDMNSVISEGRNKRYREYSRFPKVVRDVAFIVNSGVSVASIEQQIRTSGAPAVTSVTLFDVFEGKSVGEGKKSIAFSLTLNATEKTLTDAEIDAVLSSVITSVTDTFGATLRSL
ncbi:MAG: phenylalanine--tRNA ligase subunit beta [Bacteroidetes bacterium]|nr:phenylalanine--tRNA ligase subunit beta [Bacteroidota bacterium]